MNTNPATFAHSPPMARRKKVFALCLLVFYTLVPEPFHKRPKGEVHHLRRSGHDRSQPHKH